MRAINKKLSLRMRTSLPASRGDERAWPCVNRLHIRRWDDRGTCSTGGNSTDQDIEERREDETEKGDAEHAGEDRDAHDVAHLRSRAASEHQRQNTHDERERRHENRTQTNARCLERGAESIATL